MDYKEKKEKHRGQWITVLAGLPFVIGITYFMYHAFDFGAAFNDPRTTFEEAIFGIVMMMVPGLFFGGFPAGYMMTEQIRKNRKVKRLLSIPGINVIVALYVFFIIPGFFGFFAYPIFVLFCALRMVFFPITLLFRK